MKVFLSTPISCFQSKKEFLEYKNSIKQLVACLQNDHELYYEIENINSNEEIDLPENAAIKDFKEIEESDVFILHYPNRMPTSALIELGFAIALKKRIILIAPTISTLPYLAQGINQMDLKSLVVESKIIDAQVIDTIEAFIQK